ncbi:hypothetical protein CWE09_09940 [Aliidiomarina minuta]|uniref:Uncharacterized protein n=1 Tax=Aliidiomarina minuta TaxID=880057 RepID=A0A432WA53_9GAMM|nr:hypothetical protein [Aliidiomarina minuta]RUO26989.1 hypothetical protein CWE09_09940 [Aliidiomarina minuta]
MHFEIQQLSWHKRRRPGKEPQPVAIDVPDFKKEADHMCQVSVTFDNGEVLSMHGRVSQNQIKKTWSVNAINSSGQSVFARLIE